MGEGAAGVRSGTKGQRGGARGGGAARAGDTADELRAEWRMWTGAAAPVTAAQAERAARSRELAVRRRAERRQQEEAAAARRHAAATAAAQSRRSPRRGTVLALCTLREQHCSRNASPQAPLTAHRPSRVSSLKVDPAVAELSSSSHPHLRLVRRDDPWCSKLARAHPAALATSESTHQSPPSGVDSLGCPAPWPRRQHPRALRSVHVNMA